MYTITTTNTISGFVVSRFYFVHFIEAYNSFISRCDEHGYDYEMRLDNDTWTGGGRGCDITITMEEHDGQWHECTEDGKIVINNNSAI